MRCLRTVALAFASLVVWSVASASAQTVTPCIAQCGTTANACLDAIPAKDRTRTSPQIDRCMNDQQACNARCNVATKPAGK
jgi:hypothetical protein